MADQTCDHGSIRSCIMRVAVLAADGSTPSGASNLYVTDTLVELTLEPEVRAGDAFEVPNACGDLAIDFKDDDRIRWWNATLKICEPNAELSALLASGFEALEDGGDTIGGKFPPLGRVTPSNGVSIELWSIRLADDGQTKDGTYGYYQWALPRTRGWRPTTRAFTNGAIENEFVGRVFTNDNWGNGPANDWDVVTTDSPILYVVSNTIPDSACGVQATPAQV